MYGLSSMLNRAVPFFLLPILTKYLSPSEYGIVASVFVIQAFLVLISDFGMSNYVGVNYYSKGVSHSDLISEATAVLVLVSAVIFTGALTLDTIHPGLFQVGRTWLMFLVLSSVLRVIFNMLMMVWQLEQKAVIYAILQNLCTLLESVLTIIFVVIRGDGWQGRIGSNLLSGSIFGLIGFIFLFSKYGLRPFSISWQRLQFAALTGAPLILHGVGAWFINSADRFLIVKISSSSAAGIYSAASQIASIIGFVTLAFNQAWSPYLWKTLSEQGDDGKRKLVKIAYVYSFGLFVFCIFCYAVFVTLIAFVFDARYLGAIRYLPFMLGQMFCWGIYYMATNYVFFAKKTMKLTFVTFAHGILSLALNFLLIPRYSAMGSAFSGLIVSFSYMISVWCLARRVYPMPWASVMTELKHLALANFARPKN